MTTKSTRARRSRGGKIKYLVYQAAKRLRNGRTQQRIGVKTMLFAPNASSISLDRPGAHKTRTGKRVHGVAISYKSELAARSRRGQQMARLFRRIVQLPMGVNTARLMDTSPNKRTMVGAR